MKMCLGRGKKKKAQKLVPISGAGRGDGSRGQVYPLCRRLGGREAPSPPGARRGAERCSSARLRAEPEHSPATELAPAALPAAGPAPHANQGGPPAFL